METHREEEANSDPDEVCGADGKIGSRCDLVALWESYSEVDVDITEDGPWQGQE